MILQRKFIQRWKYIFGNGMRSIFPFYFFFITWNLRLDLEKHQHKSQTGRRHVVSHRYGDVCAISYSPKQRTHSHTYCLFSYLHNTKAVPGSHTCTERDREKKRNIHISKSPSDERKWTTRQYLPSLANILHEE